MHIYICDIARKPKTLQLRNNGGGTFYNVLKALSSSSDCTCTSCLQGGWRYVCVRKVMHNAFHDNCMQKATNSKGDKAHCIGLVTLQLPCTEQCFVLSLQHCKGDKADCIGLVTLAVLCLLG